MAKNKGYTVPEADRKEFDLLIQRANRRINASLKYIQKEDIKSERTQRALLGDYAQPESWAGSKSAFSRSKKFASEKHYQQFLRHVSNWGEAGDFARSVENVRKDYYQSIVKALTTTAIDNGVLTDSGRLPGNLAKKIRDLSLDQLVNFFDHGDPSEDIERQGWSSDEYIGVDRGEFVDITVSHLNKLKELFPANSTSPSKKTKTTRKRGKKTANKRRKR